MALDGPPRPRGPEAQRDIRAPLSEGSSLRARRPCLLLLCTNMFSESASDEWPSAFSDGKMPTCETYSTVHTMSAVSTVECPVYGTDDLKAIQYLKSAHVARVAGVLQAVLIALHEELEEVPARANRRAFGLRN